MKTIRKALALVLALCVVLSLAACGSQGSNESKAPESQAPASQSPEESKTPDEPAAEVELL